MNSQKKFEIKSYGKAELASFYLPDINPQSATRTFNKWIKKYPGLMEALTANGLCDTDRKYTPLHVELIVKALGLP